LTGHSERRLRPVPHAELAEDLSNMQFTVTSSIPSARAISLFETPFISSLATSSSRPVSFPSIFVPGFSSAPYPQRAWEARND
jgi:hypothetical protein